MPRTIAVETVVTTLQTDGIHAEFGGCSEYRALGFSPAFLDFETFTLHASRFADGSLAPLLRLDGLPDEVVIDRTASGRALAAKATLIPGFVRSGYFYTRRAAARAALEWARPRMYFRRSSAR